MFKTLFIRELVYEEHCQGIKFTVCIFLGCPSFEGCGGWTGEKWSEMSSSDIHFLGFHSPLLLQNLRLPVKHFSTTYLWCLQALSHWHSPMGSSSCFSHRHFVPFALGVPVKNA